MVADFEGGRIVDYYFTLPIPSWLIFVRFIVYYAITFMIWIFVLPAGTLMPWSSFSLAQVSYGKYLIIFVFTNIFYGILGRRVVELLGLCRSAFSVHCVWWCACHHSIEKTT